MSDLNRLGLWNQTTEGMRSFRASRDYWASVWGMWFWSYGRLAMGLIKREFWHRNSWGQEFGYERPRPRYMVCLPGYYGDYWRSALRD